MEMKISMSYQQHELTQNDTDWGGGMASLSISQEIPSLNFHL
jgi:hypothetical protein